MSAKSKPNRKIHNLSFNKLYVSVGHIDFDTLFEIHKAWFNNVGASVQQYFVPPVDDPRQPLSEEIVDEWQMHMITMMIQSVINIMVSLGKITPPAAIISQYERQIEAEMIAVGNRDGMEEFRKDRPSWSLWVKCRTVNELIFPSRTEKMHLWMDIVKNSGLLESDNDPSVLARKLIEDAVAELMNGRGTTT